MFPSRRTRSGADSTRQGLVHLLSGKEQLDCVAGVLAKRPRHPRSHRRRFVDECCNCVPRVVPLPESRHVASIGKQARRSPPGCQPGADPLGCDRCQVQRHSGNDR